jgi:protein-tyrosine phosphatase
MKPQLWWIDGPWQGKLAIAARPRGGDWLDDEMRGFRRAGVDAIVSLLTDEEVAEFDLSKQSALCSTHGLHFLSFPIGDRSVPISREAALGFVHKLDKALAAGKRIAIHCRQGIGRSGLLAAGLLTAAGIDRDVAIQRVSTARGLPVPETPEQRQWVSEFAAEFAASLPRE